MVAGGRGSLGRADLNRVVSRSSKIGDSGSVSRVAKVFELNRKALNAPLAVAVVGILPVLLIVVDLLDAETYFAQRRVRGSGPGAERPWRRVRIPRDGHGRGRGDRCGVDGPRICHQRRGLRARGARRVCRHVAERIAVKFVLHRFAQGPGRGEGNDEPDVQKQLIPL